MSESSRCLFCFYTSNILWEIYETWRKREKQLIPFAVIKFYYCVLLKLKVMDSWHI